MNTQEKTVCFVILPYVHLMDLSGPAQVFYEASQLGKYTYRPIYVSTKPQVRSEQGLMLSDLQPFNEVNLTRGDLIIVAGFDFKSFSEGKLSSEIRKMRPWIESQLAQGVQIASICSGSLALAEWGILNGRKCTSHWKCIDYIRKHYPKVNTQIDQLYVHDKNVFTSAGMTSGIDMSLSILEMNHGPVLSARVAREMVVYIRRDSTDTQQTIYLDYRTHFNPSIHKVQDYIISHPAKNPSLEELANVGDISVRNLTRTFKNATGHTIVDFKNAVKMELARNLMNNAEFTMDKIATMCGFSSVRHFRRVWGKHNMRQVAG